METFFVLKKLSSKWGIHQHPKNWFFFYFFVPSNYFKKLIFSLFGDGLWIRSLAYFALQELPWKLGLKRSQCSFFSFFKLSLNESNFEFSSFLFKSIQSLYRNDLWNYFLAYFILKELSRKWGSLQNQDNCIFIFFFQLLF